MRRKMRSSKVMVLGGVIAASLAVGLSSSYAHSATASAAKAKPVVRIFGFGIETDPAYGAEFPTATYVVTEPNLTAKYFNASSANAVKLEYTFCNTDGTAAGAVACAVKAKSPTACGGQPCDVALDTADPDDNEDVPLIGKEGIPIVGATTSTQEAADTKNDFGLTVSLTGLQGSLGNLMKVLGAHKVGIVSAEKPDVNVYNSTIAATLKRAGLKVAGTTILTAATASPDASISTSMSGGANGLIDTAPGNVGAAVQYAKQTFPGVKIALPILAAAAGFFNGLPNSVVKGVGVVSWLPPVTATSVPGIKEFISEGGLKAESSAYRGSDFGTMVWLATRFIGNVANNISGPITRTSMLHALQTTENVNMLGLQPPWNASQRGKGGAAPNTPYDDVVYDSLVTSATATLDADNPGVFWNATTGKVAYVDAGFKAP